MRGRRDANAVRRGVAWTCQGRAIDAISVSRRPRSSSTEPMGCVSTPHRLVEPIASERAPPADALVAVSWPRLPRLELRPDVQGGIAVELDGTAQFDNPCEMPGGSCSFGLSLSVR